MLVPHAAVAGLVAVVVRGGDGDAPTRRDGRRRRRRRRRHWRCGREGDLGVSLGGETGGGRKTLARSGGRTVAVF